MARIFVSYAREDRKYANLLSDAFESLGWSVFWDHQLRAGDIWPETIGRKLDEVDAVVAIWSEEARKSEWVLKEARHAYSRNILFPVRWDDTEPPVEFTEISVQDLANWTGGVADPSFMRLVEGLSKLLGAPEIPPLIAYVHRLLRMVRESADQRDRENAARAIRDLHEEAKPAIPIIAAQIFDIDNPTARHFLVQGIAQSRVELAEVLPTLGRLLLQDPEAEVRKEAAYAIRWLSQGSGTAVQLLLQAVHSETQDEVRAAVVSALGQEGEEGAAAVSPILRLAADDRFEGVRKNALQALGYLPGVGSEVVEGVIRRMQGDPTYEVRRQAAFTLGNMGGNNAQAVKALVDALENDDEMWVREAAADALGRIETGREAAVKVLASKLGDYRDDVEVRVSAAGSLGAIGRGLPEAALALSDALRKDGSGEVREWAARGLKDLGDLPDVSVGALSDAVIGDRLKDVRVAAVETLAELSQRSALPAIISLLRRAAREDRTAEVREAAREALEMLAS